MKYRNILPLLALALALAAALCGCNLLARVEPAEPAAEETPAEEEAPAQEEPEAVVIDSPIVGSWHNTYTADGTTSEMTFRPDGTGCETGQSDADEPSEVSFTYTVIEDYVEITVDTTTLHFTYAIDGSELALTYQGYTVAE